MDKTHTTLSIDEDLLQKAKDAGINMSNFLERGINQSLGVIKAKIPIIDGEKCDFCGREGPKETAQTLNKNIHALTWLCPDEKWICNSCLNSEKRQVVISR